MRHAIASLKSDKATGGDGISAEVLKALNDKGITIVTELLNLIYEHGHLPEGSRIHLYSIAKETEYNEM